MSGLTGKTRHRHGWFRRLILQVEVTCVRHTDPGNCGWPEEERYTTWRDATVEDLSMLFVRSLV